MDFQQIVLAKLDKIEEKQEAQGTKLEVYNSLLENHISRTEQLEMRFEPVEDHVKFIRKLCKILAVIIPIVLGTLALFLKH